MTNMSSAMHVLLGQVPAGGALACADVLLMLFVRKTTTATVSITSSAADNATLVA
jgi:hypothetical protein